MLRRRGSAPAVVLQHHFSEQRGVLFKADRIIPPTDAPWLSKARRKKDQHECGYSPPPLTLGDRRTSGDISYQSLELYDSPSPKCPSPRSPDSPNLNKKPIKHRPKRRDSEPFVPQGSNGPANARNSSSSLQRRSSSFRDYNIVLLGQGGVGKSALLVRFTTGRFIHEYDPTLELTYDMCYEVDEEPAVLHITDTASANEPFYLSQNEGFIVVYAIDEPRTFQTAKQLIKLIRELKKQRGQHTAIVLVGNKVDLNHSRSVSNTEALEFASKHECFFHETSAANNINVKVVFQDAVRQLRLFQLNRRTNGPMNSLKNFFSR